MYRCTQLRDPPPILACRTKLSGQAKQCARRNIESRVCSTQIKHPLRTPGKSGLLAFSTAMATIAFVWVVFVEGAIVRLPWAIRFGTLGRNGSVQLTFR